MTCKTVLFFVILTVFVQTCLSYSVELEPSERFCVVAVAKKGNECTGSFEVLSSEAKFVKVTVSGPPPEMRVLFESGFDATLGEYDDSLSQGSFDIDVEGNGGDYSLCFENTNDRARMLIAFNFRVMLEGEKEMKYVGIESELHELQEGIDMLRDHQSYMNQRERLHIETIESINMKVVFWTVLETLVVLGMAWWQIHYISDFFETKRKM